MAAKQSAVLVAPNPAALAAAVDSSSSTFEGSFEDKSFGYFEQTLNFRSYNPLAVESKPAWLAGVELEPDSHTSDTVAEAAA